MLSRLGDICVQGGVPLITMEHVSMYCTATSVNVSLSSTRRYAQGEIDFFFFLVLSFSARLVAPASGEDVGALLCHLRTFLTALSNIPSAVYAATKVSWAIPCELSKVAAETVLTNRSGRVDPVELVLLLFSPTCRPCRSHSTPPPFSLPTPALSPKSLRVEQQLQFSTGSRQRI